MFCRQHGNRLHLEMGTLNHVGRMGALGEIDLVDLMGFEKGVVFVLVKGDELECTSRVGLS